MFDRQFRIKSVLIQCGTANWAGGDFMKLVKELIFQSKYLNPKDAFFEIMAFSELGYFHFGV